MIEGDCMEIEWTNFETMCAETDKCYSEIQGIKEFIDAQNRVYGFKDNGLCFGDYQIDYINYSQKLNTLSLRFTGCCPKFSFNNKLCTKLFFVIDFVSVDDVNLEVAPEFWISDIFIQKCDDRYLFWCDGTTANFTYTSAKANRWWGE